MKARTYLQLSVFFSWVRGLIWPGLFMIILPCIFIASGDDTEEAVGIAMLVLMGMFALAMLLSDVRVSKKCCDALEERGLLEDAVSQLRAQERGWADDRILTKDYYFALHTGQVICLKDLARIELIRTERRDPEDGDYEELNLCLITQQGDTLSLHATNQSREEEIFQRHFESLQTRYPEKAEYYAPKAVKDPALLDAHATIVDMRSERAAYAKYGIRTIVTFSDGFRHVSHRGNRKSKKSSGGITLDSELKREILNDAIYAHDVTVEKEKNITIHEHSPKDLAHIMGNCI